MSEFVVDTDAMRRHADTLDHIGARAEEAVQAAGDCVTGGEAYGLLCSFIGAAIAPVQVLGAAATVAATATIGGTAVGVRGMAEAYDAGDDAVSRGIRAVGGLR